MFGEPIEETVAVEPITDIGASPDDPYFFGSMTNFDGYVGEGEYEPVNNEWGGVLTYCVGTFVVFSAAYAIVRRQYNKTNKKVNIKKAIKKRFNKVMGDDPDNMGNGGDRAEIRDRFVDEESKSPLDKPNSENNNDGPKKSMVDSIASRFGFTRKPVEKEGGYKDLPEGKDKPEENKQGDAQTRIWTPDGPVLIEGAKGKI